MKLIVFVILLLGCTHNFEMNLDDYDVQESIQFEGKTVYINLQKVKNVASVSVNGKTYITSGIKNEVGSAIKRILSKSNTVFDKPTDGKYVTITPYVNYSATSGALADAPIQCRAQISVKWGELNICSSKGHHQDSIAWVTQGGEVMEKVTIGAIQEAISLCEPTSGIKNPEPQTSREDILRKAKLCQKKGGIWRIGNSSHFILSKSAEFPLDLAPI